MLRKNIILDLFERKGMLDVSSLALNDLKTFKYIKPTNSKVWLDGLLLTQSKTGVFFITKSKNITRIDFEMFGNINDFQKLNFQIIEDIGFSRGSFTLNYKEYMNNNYLNRNDLSKTEIYKNLNNIYGPVIFLTNFPCNNVPWNTRICNGLAISLDTILKGELFCTVFERSCDSRSLKRNFKNFKDPRDYKNIKEYDTTKRELRKFLSLCVFPRVGGSFYILNH